MAGQGREVREPGANGVVQVHLPAAGVDGGRGTVGFWLDWKQRLKGYQDLLPSSFLCSSFLQLGFPQTTVNILQLLQFASVSFSKKAVVFLLHAKFKNPREVLRLGQFTPAAHSCTNQLCSVG